MLKSANRQVRWTIEKSKQSPIQGTNGTYWFSPQTASIDGVSEILDLAVTNGIVKKGGPWFTFDDKKYQGFANLRAAADDAMVNSILERLQSIDWVTEDTNEETG